jgi:hypothetical protein
MLDQLRLIAGNPETKKGGATFSRFVLPFRYSISPTRSSATNGSYTREVFLCDQTTCDKRAKDCESHCGRMYERLHYLTRETAEVLFKRAAWFNLKDVAEESFDIPSRHVSGRNVSVTTGARRIVLFEYPAALSRKHGDDDPLRTGFLLVDLYFSEPVCVAPRLDDLLCLNELFRYWRRPYYHHDSIDGAHSGGNDGYHQRWATMLDYPVIDAGETFSLLNDGWQTAAKQNSLDPSRDPPPGSIGNGWITYADNRTFVWTCALLEKGVDTLRETFAAPGAPAESFGHWVKLLNIDQPGDSASQTHATRLFERHWARDRTEKRWEEFGTAYGFTTHSGAMLAAPSANPPLARHWSDTYFDQTLLLLYLRVTTFRFSEELTAISARARDGGDKKIWRSEFDRLRQDFALFTNLYQFPLVSNQQQGIELYAAARKGLDIDDLFKEVQQEINSTHEYLELVYTREQMESTTVMSWIGGGGLALALTMTFLSMNLLRFVSIDWEHGTFGTLGEWLLFGIVAGVFGVLVYVASRILRWLWFGRRS